MSACQDEDDAIDTVVQPDVPVVCDPEKLDRRYYDKAVPLGHICLLEQFEQQA